MKTRITYLLVSFFLISACQRNNVKTPSSSVSEESKLEGTWELNAMTVPGKDFNELYKEKKPFIQFTLADSKFSGNTSCNSFGGKLVVTGNKIDFSGPMMMTKMYCPGEGENTFVEALKKVNKYAISDGTLNFIMGDIAVMRFSKK